MEASGLEINKEKSQTYFFNTPRITKRNILRILEFPEGSLPSEYLGACLVESTIKLVSWKELLDKINKNISLWTFRALNFLSRLILVKSVLHAHVSFLNSGSLKIHHQTNQEYPKEFPLGGSERQYKMAFGLLANHLHPEGYGRIGPQRPTR